MRADLALPVLGVLILGAMGLAVWLLGWGLVPPVWVLL
jgi:hypothetical protein